MPATLLGVSGTPDGPIAPDSWKRAIHRRAPNNFRVEVLHPEKHGSNYNYGFRVYAIRNDNVSTVTRTTSSGESIVSIDEYDIWRSWEDCLLFQDTLEVEYSRSAREKRNRLAAGKGVKKNGVYIHSDQAASWESLPFGPDPHDIARDIHEYIPKLTKKGTLFRLSQETIDNRFKELRVTMQTLFQDDLPTLVKEIKATRTFTDFFAVWRRDIDLAQKAESPKKQPTSDRSRLSLSTSMSSTFPLSISSLTVKSLSPTKGKAAEKEQIPFRTSAHSDSSSSEDSSGSLRQGRLMDRTQSSRSVRSRACLPVSHSSSSSPSTPVTAPRQLPPISRQPAVASQETPIKFGHNPHALSGERGSPILESLPEDRELSSSPKSGLDEAWARKRTVSMASRMNRNARVYVPAPPSSPHSSEPSSRSLSRYSTTSLATLGATAYLDELGVDYCLPSPTPEPRHRPRASVCSLASVVTNFSVDAVIPRSEWPARSSANNVQRPLSPPGKSQREYEPWSEDDSQPEDQGDILDTYFYDLIAPLPHTPNGYPETPTMNETMYHCSQKQSSTTVSSYSLYSDRRSSLATSVSSGSMSSSSNLTPLSIKAFHEDNIVVLRLPRHTTFNELRQKIYDKFSQTDKSTICDSFAMALLEQAPAEVADSGRPRAGSVSSLGSVQAKGAILHFITSQDEWDDVIAIHRDKILLRIIGSRE